MFRKSLFYSCVFFFVFFLILNSFASSIFNLKFYERMHGQSGTTVENDLYMKLTYNLNFFFHDKENLSEEFNEQEVLHLADVKILIHKGFMIYYLITGLLLINIGLVYYLYKTDFILFLGHLFRTTGFIMIIIFLLILFLKNSFSWIFLQFHYLFFNNDLWMLDPATDILIQMYPETFFFAMATKIVLGFLVRGIFVYFFSMGIERYLKTNITLFF